MAGLPHQVSEEMLYDDAPGDFNPAQEKSDAIRRQFTAAWDMNRVPTLTLPNGWSQGLPTALQLVGRPGSEATLCRAGYAFQQATDFVRHPQV